MTQALLPGMPPPDAGGELDHWQTPSWATEAVLPFLPARLTEPGGSVLIEPSVGRGAILDVALPTLRPFDWLAWEIDPTRHADVQHRYPGGAIRCGDFLTDPIADNGGFYTPGRVLFLGNPPYSLATEFVEKCLRIADGPTLPSQKGVVAMLLQHDFATGVDRCERIHDRYKGSLFPLRRRPKFGNDATGMRPFSWFVWDLGFPTSEWRPIG